MSIDKQVFGQTGDHQSVYLFTLTNRHDMRVKITNFGGYIVAIEVPDRNGKSADVVLGYDTLAGYENDRNYMGCIVGRYANRIAEGRFTLAGQTYTLDRNNHGNHLHGGKVGFNKKLWRIEGEDSQTTRLLLTCLSPDGDQHYPGNLSVQVSYSLSDNNALKIEYSATTDRETIVNLTNHSYFNLTGENPESILHHRLEMIADRFTVIDSRLIPTGELRPVAGTPLDFTQPQTIDSRIDDDYEQLKFAKGYDHNFMLRKPKNTLRLAARLSDPESGRLMEVYTTEPGLQFYSGNFLDGSVIGKKNQPYRFRSGLCLETQHFPDSPNHPQFPSTVLKPGDEYRSTTIFRFDTDGSSTMSH
jgi:aldose 1-epimerase